jgi:hypothetical protein
MKILISMALIATFLLTSCTKTYNCSCTFVDAAGNKQTKTIGAMNTTKNKAQKKCDDWGNQYKPVGGSVSSCQLY